jgi:hypothetical protein
MSREVNDTFGYVDYTLEDPPRPIYCGLGSMTRVKTRGRNNKHTHITNKYGFCRVIELQNASHEIAKVWEVGVIAAYHTFINDPLYNGIGCNFTVGGDGAKGHKAGVEERLRRKAAITTSHNTPEYLKEASVRAKKQHADPIRKERHRQGVKASHQNPETEVRRAASIAIANQRPETKARRSALSKRLRADPAYEIKRLTSYARTISNRTPERTAVIRKQIKEMCARPEVKAKRSASQKDVWAQEGVREARSQSQVKAQNKPETRAKRIASLRAYHARKTFRMKSHAWFKLNGDTAA